MARGFVYGHEVFFDFALSSWCWTDNGEHVEEPVARTCPECALSPTPEGHDACLGTLPGVVSACCGHGSPTLSGGGLTLKPMALMKDGTKLTADTPEQLRQRVLERITAGAQE